MSAAREAADDARDAARRASGSHTVQDLARWGLATRGVMYLVVAVLAGELAFGRREQPTGQGALRAVAHEPLGTALLVLLALGLGAHACWRVVQAVAGPHDAGGAPRAIGQRLADAGRAVLYGSLAGIAVELLVGRNPSDTSNRQEQDWTGKVLHWPGGRVLVVAIGFAIVVGGIWVACRGFTGRYQRDLRLGEMAPAMRATVSTLAKLGVAARSVVAVLVGAFLVEAAVTYDPAKSTGIDGALDRLRHHAYGPVLLALVAAGLAAYGLYSFAEARYGEVTRQ